MAPLFDHTRYDYGRRQSLGGVSGGSHASSGRISQRPPMPQPSKSVSEDDAMEPQQKEEKCVHFSDSKGLELEECRQEETTYYSTPSTARQVIHNGSTRRFASDELELFFADDVGISKHVPRCDYAVMQLEARDQILVCGCLQMRKVKMGIPMWQNCWAELYHGILILRKYKDTVDRKRTLLPITACSVDLVSVDDHTIEVTYHFQFQKQKQRLRFTTKSDLFMWQWCIQLASQSRFDDKELHRSVRRTTTSPVQLLEDSNHFENVLFPRSVRSKPNHTRRFSRMMSHPVPTTNQEPSTPRKGVTHLIFIRHGEAENIHFKVADQEKGLTRRGREQARLTARFVEERLRENLVNEANVELIHGSLRRAKDTAEIFAKSIPWLQRQFQCCFLDDGAPSQIDVMHRQDYRDAMHKMAFEFICRWDANEEEKPVPMQHLENYKIIICHTSFIQFCIAQCHQIPKEIVQLGAPISHCSITQVDVMKDDVMDVIFSNRITHLPLTHRTSE